MNTTTIETLKGGRHDMPRTFASWVREKRKEAGMTQDDLRIALSMSRGYINRLECGREKATLETATAIAAALGQSIDEAALVELLSAEELVENDPNFSRWKQAWIDGDLNLVLKLWRKRAA